ncbi:MAG: tRNA pseudouridine(55) synthase TruB [Patescibacteria group bacterium]
MDAVPSGFLAIDKPVDWTSHDVVAKLRRITGVKTIGHAGTLDPFATGLLIVGIGREATKRLSEFQKQEKEYVATARFDGMSDTDDVTGKISPSRVEGQPKTENIRTAFAAEVGTRQQVPPAYSAKKIGGKKMYDLARAGTPVEAKPTEITIRVIEVTRIAWPDVDFTLTCSTGTYVRAVARDVGERLGTGGYLTALRRTKSGNRSVSDAMPIERLTPETWKTFLWK